MNPVLTALLAGLILGGFLTAWVLVLVTLTRLTKGDK